MSKQIFLSHAWGKDELDRDNHLRCKELCDKLLAKGYGVWFDQYDIYGNIDSAIIKGINNCDIVLICLTEKYCKKINCAVNQQTPNDNCYKEWNYSLFKQKILIPIIMEDKMKNIFFQEGGVIQMYLNATMFIDLTESIDNEIDILYKTLRKFNVYTKMEQKFYNIKPNNSFDNLVGIVNNAIKNLSPRIKHLSGSTSPTSLASPTSPTSPISLASPTSPTSPISPISFTNPNSHIRPTRPIRPTRSASPISSVVRSSSTSPLNPRKHELDQKQLFEKEITLDTDAIKKKPKQILRKNTKKRNRVCADKLSQENTKKINIKNTNAKKTLIEKTIAFINNKKLYFEEKIRV